MGRLKDFWFSNCHSPNQNLIALALLSPAVPLTSFLKYDFEVVAIHIFKITFICFTRNLSRASIFWNLNTFC